MNQKQKVDVFDRSAYERVMAEAKRFGIVGKLYIHLTQAQQLRKDMGYIPENVVVCSKRLQPHLLHHRNAH